MKINKKTSENLLAMFGASKGKKIFHLSPFVKMMLRDVLAIDLANGNIECFEHLVNMFEGDKEIIEWLQTVQKHAAFIKENYIDGKKNNKYVKRLIKEIQCTPESLMSEVSGLAHQVMYAWSCAPKRDKTHFTAMNVARFRAIHLLTKINVKH